jgi:hypothetical protein
MVIPRLPSNNSGVGAKDVPAELLAIVVTATLPVLTTGVPALTVALEPICAERI